MTLSQFDRLFPDEPSCWTYLLLRRWPDGPHCPRCDNTKVYESTARPWHWQCKKCGKDNRSPYRFSLKTKTIFEETKLPLRSWFKVLHLMLTSKKGISALQIHRMLGTGSYRSAWYMCMRLRAGMNDPQFRQLMGIVEVDETYIGGKDKNRHWNKKSAQRRKADPRGPLDEKIGYGKIGVIGAIERKGNVVCHVIGQANALTLAGFVRHAVSDKVSLVATDDNQAYNYISRDIRHEAVNHSAGEYVRGEIHTNNIESFWALLKRGIVGTYHNVSKDYLPLYLAEFQFRYNNRNNPDIFGLAIAGC
ncbi:MAG: IS1595 family transposase [Candidatus Binataceae bacterium]